MSRLAHVTEVELVGDHSLRLRFDDGAQGDLDFSNHAWRGIFAPLVDPDYFAKVEVDGELGTVVWPNGADIAPETLHRWVTDKVGTVPV
jgi:hypothetical protein